MDSLLAMLVLISFQMVTEVETIRTITAMVMDHMPIVARPALRSIMPMDCYIEASTDVAVVDIIFDTFVGGLAGALSLAVTLALATLPLIVVALGFLLMFAGFRRRGNRRTRR